MKPPRLISSLALFASWGAFAADAPPDDDVPSAELREHHRHHQHGGITQFIEMSLDTLGEAEGERPVVEKVQSTLHACMEPVEQNERKVLLLLADGVAAGKIDAAQVDANIAAVNGAATAIHDCAWSALNQLHAALSPVERAALADKVQSHWAVWRSVNHEAEPGGREKEGRLAALAKELALTAEQQEKISAALRAGMASLAGQFDPEKVKAHVQGFAQAFAADAFDAKPVVSNTTAAVAMHGMKRMALFYETLTPLLTAEQRTTLAQHLREHANHHPGA